MRERATARPWSDENAAAQVHGGKVSVTRVEPTVVTEVSAHTALSEAASAIRCARCAIARTSGPPTCHGSYVPRLEREQPVDES